MICLSIKTMVLSLSLILLLLLLCPISFCMESQEDLLSSLQKTVDNDFDSIIYLPDEQRCDSPLYSKVQISLFVETNQRNGRRILTNHEDRQLEYSLSYTYKQDGIVAGKAQSTADERQVVTQSKALSWCLLVEDPFSNNDQLTLSYSLTITIPSSSSSSIADDTHSSSSKLDAVEGVLLCGEFFVKVNKPYQIDRNKLLRCKSYSEKVSQILEERKHLCIHAYLLTYIYLCTHHMHTTMHTYIHTYIHIYMHTYIHTNKHTYIHYIKLCIHTSHTYIQHILHHMHTCVLTYIHISLHTSHTTMHTYIYIQPYIHTFIHHMHPDPYMPILYCFINLDVGSRRE